MLTIQQQKILATQVYNKLLQAGYKTVLAGGAPRDWYYNKPATDLDFYIPYISYKDITEILGVEYDNVTPPPEVLEIYDHSDLIDRVLTYKHYLSDIGIQLIGIPDTEKFNSYVVDGFSCSVSQIMYDFEADKYIKHSNFRLTELTKIMFPTNSDTAWEDKYMQKVANKFPAYITGTLSLASSKVLTMYEEELAKPVSYQYSPDWL